MYCACPNEISAARLAARLRAAGYTRIWALRGGYDAWSTLTTAAGADAAVVVNVADLPGDDDTTRPQAR